MNRSIKNSLGIICLGLLLGGAPALADMPYAPQKAPCQDRCMRSAMTLSLPGPYPAHAIIFASGGLFNKDVDWIVIDLDQKTMTREVTRREQASDRVNVTQAAATSLPDEQIAALLDKANAVWAYEVDRDDPPIAGAMDTTDNLVLLDGDAARNKTFQIMTAKDPARDLKVLLQSLAQPAPQ